MEFLRNQETSSKPLTIIAEGWAKKETPTFDELTTFVLQTHQITQTGAIRAVNQLATYATASHKLIRPAQESLTKLSFCYRGIEE